VKLARLAGILALLLGLLAPVASVSAASTIYVHPGQSIQAAINKAPSGGLVVVERGTYRGNLEIKRSVRLLGHDAVIVPAAKPTKSICSSLLQPAIGICVHGTVNADQSIRKAVASVSIEGITVRNFGGSGILAYGVAGLRVVRNVMAHNGGWGMYVADVSNLSLLYNRSYDNGADGFQVARSPSSNAAIVGNTSYGNHGTGILFLDSLGGRIALNDVHGNCAGIVVAHTGDPDASGGGNVAVQLNQVTANNRVCAASADMGTPAYGGIGIALIGAQNTVVALNDIRNNLAVAGSAFPDGGGILLLDGAAFGAGAPSGNSIRLNWLSGNTPNDIFGDGTGLNTVSGNTCTTTNLTGAC
jgi:hypothetical protein